MLKKICAIAIFYSLPLLFPTMTYAADNSNAHVLGISREQWNKDLKVIGGEYEFAPNFLDLIQQNADELKIRRGAQHFEEVGTKEETAKDKRRNNPLMQLRPKRTRSAYITDLDMDERTYRKVLTYIPYLGYYYSEKHIAQILPYIVLCFNYDISQSEINFYVKNFVKKQTPPDIATERLYNVVENKY